MKKTIGIGIAALALLTAMNSQATVDLTLTDLGYSVAGGISGTLNGVGVLSGDYIGLYGFTVGPANDVGGGVQVPSPFYSVCIAPEGNLTYGTYSYTAKTFAQAAPGLNPSGLWSTAGAFHDAGIQNANALYSTFESLIVNHVNFGGVGSSAEQGAALALAMYTALYDSTGYNATTTSGMFNITSFGSGNIAADYSLMLAVLTGSSLTRVAGTILVPNNPNPAGPSGQEFPTVIGIPNTFPGVPEPSTVMAGLLLLMPFGTSALRTLRRKSAV